MRYFQTCFLILIGITSIGYAQKGAISGRVKDEANFSLPSASIQILSLKKGTITNQSGDFVIPNLDAGTYEVLVSYLGFNSAKKTVTVEGGKTTQVAFQLSPTTIDGTEVLVVREGLKGQAKALHQQQNNDQISNIVSADQVGRFPDANIGDALKRIPGITVMYDQGEARFGVIRGTEPRLNAVSINGERIPSAEGEVRNMQLDLVPSDIIQTVEVNKAVLPEMDADAIGGSVNLVTRSAPNGLRVSATASGGYNVLRSKPITNFGLVIGNRFLKEKLGLVLSATYHDRQFGSDNTEGIWDKTADGKVYVAEWDVRRYDIQRTRRSGSVSLDYKLSPTSVINVNGIYNWRDDWENRYRIRYTLGAPDANGVQSGRISRQTKGGINDSRNGGARLEDQRMAVFSLGGKHLLGNKIKLDWATAYTQASEERPDERYVEFRTSSTGIKVNSTDPGAPQFTVTDPTKATLDRFSFRRIEQYFQFTEESDRNARLNLEIPVEFGDNKGDIKVGGRYKAKSKLRDNTYSTYAATKTGGVPVGNLSLAKNADYTTEKYLAGDYQVGSFATETFLGDLNLEKTSPDFVGTLDPSDFVPANFEASETISAGFIQWKQNLTDYFSFIAGVRLENTGIEYSGFEYNDNLPNGPYTKLSNDDAYLNVLPSVLLKYKLNDNRHVIRASWTNTLARPNYYDLVPYRLVSNDAKEIETGNPTLKATTSMNFDLMYDFNWGDLGLFTAGGFHKSLNNFIYRSTSSTLYNGETFKVLQPKNGAKASLYGFETSFQRPLDFLPSALKYLNIYLNYTYTQSETDSPDFVAIKKLPGTAEHTMNSALGYEGKRFSLRVAFNYSSPFLDPEDTDLRPGLERYYDAVTYLDVNGSFAFSKSARFFFEANNLLNQPLRYYSGVQERTYQAEYYGLRFNAGLKVDLNK